ncbi:MAG: exodeoxyribonuclease VII small subunit [Opitutales bacterium]|nr:exodeoxyribonuclease VII small subunit [Opitutales bacterium]
MSKTKKNEKGPTFEEELARLEAIVESLEGGEVPLAELVERYEAGMRHLKNCQEKLADAELRIEQLRSVSAEGEAETQPFEDGEY